MRASCLLPASALVCACCERRERRVHFCRDRFEQRQREERQQVEQQRQREAEQQRLLAEQRRQQEAELQRLAAERQRQQSEQAAAERERQEAAAVEEVEHLTEGQILQVCFVASTRFEGLQWIGRALHSRAASASPLCHTAMQAVLHRAAAAADAGSAAGARPATPPNHHKQLASPSIPAAPPAESEDGGSVWQQGAAHGTTGAATAHAGRNTAGRSHVRANRGTSREPRLLAHCNP